MWRCFLLITYRESVFTFYYYYTTKKIFTCIIPPVCSDPRYSFIATRILATLLRLKPALIAYSHYYEVLLKLLDHIPSLHDYDGFDRLYVRSLEEHKQLLPDHDNSWPYDCETLKSSDLVALKGLITTIRG